MSEKDLRRCNICGFMIDLCFKATAPTVEFGRNWKHKKMSAEDFVQEIEVLVWELQKLRDKPDFPGSPEEVLYLRLSAALDSYRTAKFLQRG